MFTRALLSCIAVFLVGAVCGCQAPSTKVSYQVEEKTVAELSADMASGAVTSESLVRLYLHRIEILDLSLIHI